MKKNVYLLFCLFSFLSLSAQSPRTAVVEHFTNSVCSICASKNPAFYQTLSNYPQVLHIAFYPSSPYNYCFFNVQNKQENDDRTKYYSAYGATPQVAVNGVLLPIATPAISNTTLDTVVNKTSPVEIRAYEEVVASDSVQVRIIVKTTAANSLANVRLFAGAVENPIDKTTQNGETVHYDVFRKALTKITGDSITLPALNDSTVYYFGYKIKNDWQADKLYTLAWVQLAATKKILNAGKSVRAIATGVEDMKQDKMSLFPNPVGNRLYLTGVNADGQTSYSIFNITGKRISEGKIAIREISVEDIAPGIYFLKVGGSVVKFIKQ